MRKVFVLIIFAVLVVGCSNKKTAPPSPPSAAALLFPDNNAACITGTVVSATQSKISFSWQGSANTSEYTLVVKNLLTSDSSQYNSNSPGIDVTLLQNTPYSWRVISKSNQITTTASSPVWKFYNSGPGVTSHAPFPADLTSPAFAQTVSATNGKVTLTWNCTDVDNDIAGYDVYFGTTTTPALLQSSVTATTMDANVTSGATYYWMIVAKDSKGNTSTSQVSQFVVN